MSFPRDLLRMVPDPKYDADDPSIIRNHTLTTYDWMPRADPWRITLCVCDERLLHDAGALVAIGPFLVHLLGGWAPT